MASQECAGMISEDLSFLFEVRVFFFIFIFKAGSILRMLPKLSSLLSHTQRVHCYVSCVLLNKTPDQMQQPGLA